MNHDSKSFAIVRNRRWRMTAAITLTLFLGTACYVYVAQPWGPGPNGPWSAADQNRDGVVAREEMELFGTQKPHRNLSRLLMHFDKADTNHDGRVTQDEIDAYGKDIGSRDPANHAARGEKP